MKGKKVRYEDISYILQYKEKHFFKKWCCNHYILPKDNEGYCVYGKMKLICYLLCFIPVHIVSFFVLIWDGGLKNFCIQSREIYHWNFYKYDYPSDRIRELNLF